MPDYYQILTISLGQYGCKTGRCPGCISEMTTSPRMRYLLSYPGVDLTNLDIALNKAIAGLAKGILFTGRGSEPADYAAQVFQYQTEIEQRGYDSIGPMEIQTNGISLVNPKFLKENWLAKWYDKNMRVICLSAVSVNDKENFAYFNPHLEEVPSIPRILDLAHTNAYHTRLSMIMKKGVVDTPEKLEEVIHFCKKYGVEQLTVRPMRATCQLPDWKKGKCAYDYVKENEVTLDQEKAILRYVYEHITPPEGCSGPDDPNFDPDGSPDLVEILAHGARVFEIKGDWGIQNICTTDCITHKPKEDKEEGHRQIILYHNGMIMPNWTHETAFVGGCGFGLDALKWYSEHPPSENIGLDWIRSVS